ncbi:hypothetical protein NE541_15305, partial [Coprococcus eutactus]|nr:hypothetical protein [Coprococcus eutactus]
DEKHIPTTVVLHMTRQTRHLKMLTAQHALTKPRQNTIWQQNVKTQDSKSREVLKILRQKE